MRMYHKLFRNLNNSDICFRSIKKIKYESIDFNFNPRHLYKHRRIIPTKYKIPTVPYKQQYESRDF